jgi:hypothetical protein
VSEWQRFGRAVAGPSDAASERLERRVLAQGSAPRRRRWSVVAIVVAVAAALLLAIALRGRSEAPVATPATAVRIATHEHEQSIALPHAGTLVVHPGASVELEVAEHTGAIVQLHEGAVTLDVERHDGARWIVDVDAFRVEAIGTRFHVRRTDGAPEVEVEEGVVRLTGPGLPSDGLRIAAAPATAVARVDVEVRDPAPVEPPAPDPIEPDAAPTEVARAPRSPAWWLRFRDALDRGDTRGAVALLPTSFPTGREGLAAADFLDAGDALAASHEEARAERSYRAACSRRQAAACGIATFRLALMRARAGDHDEAIALASRYLDDHPRGSLAREVTGRRMQWRLDRGANEAAREDAARYLARWPQGPHAALARRIADAGP